MIGPGKAPASWRKILANARGGNAGLLVERDVSFDGSRRVGAILESGRYFMKYQAGKQA